MLKLIDNPRDLSPQIKPYFNGWDKQSPTGGGVCIHHPRADLKKISTYFNSPAGNTQSWSILFSETQNGYSQIYHGSSGAPLYNSNHRVIGQASSMMVKDECESQYAFFGRFDTAWDYGNIPERRLKDWLDPDNLGVDFLDGTSCPITYLTNLNISGIQTIEGCNINFENVNISDGASVDVIADCEVFIDGSFEVEF